MLAIFLFSCSENKIAVNPKEVLGRYLFFDTRLSVNNTKSCASCHNPAFAFSDGYRTSATALGENTIHNAPSIINATDLLFFDWANPTITTLDSQIKRPLYHRDPIELGMDVDFKNVQTLLKTDSLYQKLFCEVFGANATYSKQEIEACIIAYEKQLTSYNSQYDKAIHLFSESEKRGMQLFMNDTLQCASCHKPPTFTLATQMNTIDSVYINTGLYSSYPKNDHGIFEHTHLSKDIGKYKIPSLRNVMLTAPYMHDGSLASIQDVLLFYAQGGFPHSNKDKRIKGFSLSEQDKQDIIHFLQTLTDTTILANPLFTNPFHQ